MRNLLIALTRSVCRNPVLKKQFVLSVPVTAYHFSTLQFRPFSTTPIMEANLGDMRRPYRPNEHNFDVESLVPSRNPFDQFEAWMKEAMECKKIDEPNAMAIATSSPEGQPSVRMMLLKHYDTKGFVFFTSFDSRKGGDLAANKHAAILFYWEPLHRQIRIEGLIEQIPFEDADAYWARRPYPSQISALSGLPQSSVIPNKEVLDEKIKQAGEKYPSTAPVPRPEKWGGFCLKPHVFEFWQGHTNRNHDRLRFVQENGGWKIERLAP